MSAPILADYWQKSELMMLLPLFKKSIKFTCDGFSAELLLVSSAVY